MFTVETEAMYTDTFNLGRYMAQARKLEGVVLMFSITGHQTHLKAYPADQFNTVPSQTHYGLIYMEDDAVIMKIIHDDNVVYRLYALRTESFSVTHFVGGER